MPAGARVHVCLGPDNDDARVGTAYLNVRRGAVTTSFVYDGDYLAQAGSWPVSPDLPLAVRSSTAGLPGAFADSAPDRWGLNLIRKRILAEAREAGRTAPTITDVDFPLGVSDLTRQGALLPYR
jgi:serine/threonine-protein kinase HipA